ncbi:MAG TPA: nitroreductase family deazaflavin-dependent oxidoreductase [Acidimicrobiales bacterium]|nr:nitroreductase family deazaflavin-dependent oxidoreductase [Acidimicrobiales bacterium]
MRHTAGSYVIGPYLLLHQRVYRWTRGAVGRHAGGRPTLLLHTVGRKTGKARATALVYATDGAAQVVVASYGGAPQHPGWYLNLRSRPEVEVQVGRRRWPATARVAEGEERDRLWELVNERNRGLARFFHRGAVGRYDVYQRHTRREIPVVVLDPA